MNSIKTSQRNLKKQHGMATLLMSMVMIFTVSMISIYAAQIGVTEQKISSNHYRNKQAFEAAQAGLDIALSQLNFEALSALITDNNPSLEHVALIAELDDYVGINSTLTNAAGTFITGRYRLRLARVAGAANNDILVFTSYGYVNDVTPEADNSNANQTITMKLKKSQPAGFTPPPANFVALGDVHLGGNNGSKQNLYNTTGDPMATVWASGAVSGTASYTTMHVDNGYETDPQNGIYQNHTDLQIIAAIADADVRGETLFQNFFGLSKSQMKSQATVVDCFVACKKADLEDLGFPKIVWVDAYDAATGTYKTLDINGDYIDGTLGGVSNPIILIVDGNLKINISPTAINGMIYTTQSFLNAKGTINITGSLISEGDMFIDGQVTSTYDKNALEEALLDPATYTRLPGSWIDI